MWKSKNEKESKRTFIWNSQRINENIILKLTKIYMDKKEYGSAVQREI